MDSNLVLANFILMEQLWYLFPLLFIGFWVLLVFTMSKIGWQKLIDRYGIEPNMAGEKFGAVSMTVGNATYSNAVILRYDHHGIYLKPTLFIRMFHKPVFIPWKDITVTETQSFFITSRRIAIGNPEIAFITGPSKLFSHMPAEYYQKRGV